MHLLGLHADNDSTSFSVRCLHITGIKDTAAGKAEGKEMEEGKKKKQRSNCAISYPLSRTLSLIVPTLVFLRNTRNSGIAAEKDLLPNHHILSGYIAWSDLSLPDHVHTRTPSCSGGLGPPRECVFGLVLSFFWFFLLFYFDLLGVRDFFGRGHPAMTS